jgi:hydroxyethylthiazole kinase-like uncharacterized protein yjeF
MRIVTSREMRDIDQAAIDKFKIPSIVLMENAGLRTAQIVAQKYQELGWSSDILVFAGKGKNGGDALVTARHLIAMGLRVRLFVLHGAHAYKDEAKQNLEILLSQKVRPIVLEAIGQLEEFLASSQGPFLAVDGLLGIGFKGPLAGLYADVVDLVNAKADFIISLDIPTGVDATTGAVVGNAINADITISYGFNKLGHFIAPGALHRGELRVVDIALPPRFQQDAVIHALTIDNVAPLLRSRDRYGHKNSFGHTLLIGGSRGKLGAISLAARACLRVGTGLVTVATWEDSFDNLLVRLDDEIMAMPVSFEERLYAKYKEQIKDFSSIVVGPGMGKGERAQRLFCDLLDFYHGPLVIDADAINLLTDDTIRKKLASRKGPSLITPHPGEMARMLNISTSDVVNHPKECVERAAEQMNAVVLLKGATTFISAGEGQLYLNHYPNDGMATAGSGDVLAGMIGGIVGQGLNPREAVCLGVFSHTLSGEIAALKLGHRAMTASDIIAGLGEAFLKLRTTRENLKDL